MLIKSNCRLSIINGPSEKWELSGFRTEGLVWPKWKLQLLNAHSEFFLYDWAYVAEQNIRLWKNLKGGVFF